MLQFVSLNITNLSSRTVKQKQVLRSINIDIIKNQCIAVICENNQEKNMLLQIMQKKDAYQGGTITINNKIPLTQVDMKDWHQMIGVIQGNAKIFPTYALENIVMQDYTFSNKIHRFEDIHKFIKDYGFDDFIQSLPQGYATILGESGVNLSSGQKQILALIRVLYKKPQLLILDEFTSAMDRNTEHFVLQLLKRLKSKISIIFISHRLHSLKQIADQIYVIENGETVVHGSHKELLRTANFYSDFWTDILQEKDAVKLIL